MPNRSQQSSDKTSTPVVAATDREATAPAPAAQPSSQMGNFVREVDQIAQRIATQGIKGADADASAALVTELAGIRDRASAALQPGEPPKVEQLR